MGRQILDKLIMNVTICSLNDYYTPDSIKAGWNKYCVSCFERLRKNRVGRSEEFYFFLRGDVSVYIFKTRKKICCKNVPEMHLWGKIRQKKF